MTDFKYHRIYKYQLDEALAFQTHILGQECEVDGGWVRLEKNGMLHFRAGYSWDGCTVVPDAPGTLRGSIPHDGLYQLMGEGHLSKKYRGAADKVFREVMKEDQAGGFLRWLYFTGVRVFGWAFI